MEPDSPQSRLNQRQHVEQAAVQQSRQGTEYASVEDLLRHDRAATPPPVSLEPRLRRSVEQEPCVTRPWWKRWLGW
jgi:hypothetical protein